MTKILVIAEHDGTALNPSTADCLLGAHHLVGGEEDTG